LADQIKSGQLSITYGDDHKTAKSAYAGTETKLELNSSDKKTLSASVTIPAGTTINPKDSSKSIDFGSMSLKKVEGKDVGGHSGVDKVHATIQWGVPNLGLKFDKPITLKVFVGTDLNGKTLSIQRSTSGTGGWTSEGIVSPATCVVALGYCTFSATQASYYSTVTSSAPAPVVPAPAPSNGGPGAISDTSRIAAFNPVSVGQVLGASILDIELTQAEVVQMTESELYARIAILESEIYSLIQEQLNLLMTRLAEIIATRS